MAKKSKTPNKAILIGLFSLLIIVLAFGIFSNVQQTSLSSGFIIKSITAPNYVTSNPNLASYNWRIIANVLGSEQIKYTMSPQQFKSLSGTASKNDFTIAMQSFTENVAYSVQSDYPIKDFEYTFIKGGTIINREPSACPSNQNALSTYQFVEINTYPIQNVRHCLYILKYGWKGFLNPPTTKFDAQMTLSAKGIEITKSITSEDSVVVFDLNGEALAKAQWTGSLVTGDSLPNVNDKIAILQTGSAWYLISQDNWNKYLNAETDFENIWRNIVADDNKLNSDNLVNQFKTQLSNYKFDRSNLLGQRVFIDNSQWQNGNSKDDAKLTYNLNTRLLVPEIAFDVRADWIGIEILSGTPKITSISCSVSTSGSKNIITATVKNIGQEKGTFAFEKTGCSSFKQSFTALSEQITLLPNDEKSNLLEIDSGATNEHIVEICDLKVYDVADPTRYDTRQVVCEQAKLKICDPNALRTENLCAMKCNSDGTGETISLCCPSKPPVLDAKTFTYKCQDETPVVESKGLFEKEGCFWKIFGVSMIPDFNCLAQNKIKLGLQVLGMIMVILIGIASYYVLMALNKKLKIKENKPIFITVSILIALLTYVLLFILWYIALIIIIGIGISYYVYSRIKKK